MIPHLSELLPPSSILDVWRTFDDFCMETLTKVWVFHHNGPHQRTVHQMEADRARFGASGNCFDLSLWLMQRLSESGIQSHPISTNRHDPEMHVAVLAYDKDGRIFLCDLGDMWMKPILVSDSVVGPVGGFFPNAKVSFERLGKQLHMTYHWSSGQISTQNYDLRPFDDFLAAAQENQTRLMQQLVEQRCFSDDALWAFDDGRLRWYSNRVIEPVVLEDNFLAARAISKQTTMQFDYVLACLNLFSDKTE